jgi:hypothetical protein
MAHHTRNVVVFLTVAAAHVAGIVLVRWSPYQRPPPADDVGTVYLINPTPRPMLKRAAKRTGGLTDTKSTPHREREPEVSINDPTMVAPAIDWGEEGHAAAGSVVKRKMHEEALRPLISKPKSLTPAPEKVEMGIFTLTPPHTPGTVENLGEGVTREWVSAYCYWFSDMGPEGRVPKKKCLPKFANSDRENLFKKFRPKYLDVPEPKDSQQAGDHPQAHSTAEQ